MPDRPVQDIAVALAGPAVNLLIFGVLSGFVQAPGDFEGLARLEHAGPSLLERLATVNLALALFNFSRPFHWMAGAF